jgi:hypothetical protein
METTHMTKTHTDAMRCADARGSVKAKVGQTLNGHDYLYISAAVARRWHGQPPTPPAPYRAWISTSDSKGLRAFAAE